MTFQKIDQDIQKLFVDSSSQAKAKWWSTQFQNVIDHSPASAENLYKVFRQQLFNNEVTPDLQLTTPFRNTIPISEQAPLPGNNSLMRRIRSLVRWNAMAMVMRANEFDDTLGGHISTFASSATLYDIGFNFFWKGGSDHLPGDLIYFQGHSAPGIYARSFLDGRLTIEQLQKFRQEAFGDGLSSYPHPQLMPNYWQFPTVSMGLGPITAIYQAHVMRYLGERKLLAAKERKIWCFCGDGEMDEPESLGAISLAGREKLSNLIFVINCNLQRLDGPVRGNGKIIQELERIFRGANWNVIKVVWGRHWDPLFAKDEKGLLQSVMDEVVDGELQNYKAKGGAYVRDNFFGRHPELRKMVEQYSDEDIYMLNRGGHDPYKIYAAYHKAVHETNDRPTVILTLTTKGYGIGSREADNTTHQTKKLSQENLRHFRDRFNIPVGDAELSTLPFYKPSSDSPEMKFLRECRERLGGELPYRQSISHSLKIDSDIPFNKLITANKGKEAEAMKSVSTTQGFVRLLTSLLRDKQIADRVVPIVPDEARTFGMESLFRTHGIYSSVGQKYTPEDAGQLTAYHESKEGKLLEEGINEAGAYSAWLALATSYSTNDLPMIPFFLFYSMFGFQRIMDLIWLGADMQARGFLLGCTAGRTTLNGEGLQHQDGHSLVMAQLVPNCVSYDPGTAAELAVIVKDGIDRMYNKHENIFYYLTLYNESAINYPLEAAQEQEVLDGIYLLKATSLKAEAQINLMGSGPALHQAITASEKLEEQGIATNVWSVPSFTQLRRQAMQADIEGIDSHLQTVLKDQTGVYLAVTDYVSSYPDSVRKWIPGDYYVLGTDGFGRSDTRENLRKYFGVDANSICEKGKAVLQIQSK